MDTLDKARATQLANIEARTGLTLAELRAIIAAEGLQKHGQMRDFAKTRFGLGHGDANSLVHYAFASDGQTAGEGKSTDAVLDEIYAGDKAGLRPIHDAVKAAIDGFGAYETTPKKGYVSLRRAKQFAMVGPGTKSQVEVGINLKDALEGPRAKAQAPGGMCQYKVRVANAAEVDAELVGWLKRAYDAAG